MKIDTSLSAISDTVLATPSSIRQIIFNLLTNAIDSMPDGGELAVSTSNADVNTEEGEKPFLKIEVTDSSGVLPKGFNGAQAAPSQAKLTHEGDRTALKLSSVYGIVSRLDGTVTVTSEPGEVTRVEVLLPLAETTTLDPKQKVRKRLAPSCIWVVDDDDIFRDMCQQVLLDDGHQVDQITSGVELQGKWKEAAQKPDLLVIDFSMPEYNGLEMCQWLRAQGSKAPVILVSGFAENQPDIKKALKLRKVYFLQKPFSVPELGDIVTVALGETLIGE